MRKLIMLLSTLLIAGCVESPNWTPVKNEWIDHTFKGVYNSGKHFAVLVSCRNKEISIFTKYPVDGKIKARFDTMPVVSIEGNGTDRTFIKNPSWFFVNLSMLSTLTLQYEDKQGRSVMESLDLPGLSDAMEKACK